LRLEYKIRKYKEGTSVRERQYKLVAKKYFFTITYATNLKRKLIKELDS